MSDLAQRLRGSTKWYHSDCELKQDCAARIEKLEEQNKELLEALENLLKVHEGEGGTQYNAADMARAAIAKAKED